MKFGIVTDPRFERHSTPSGVDHVERPERLRAIADELKHHPWSSSFLQQSLRQATDAELLELHRPEVLSALSEITAVGGGNLDPDTFVNSYTEECARLAVGSGIDLCRSVLQGKLDRGFAMVRPPGHHATPERSMGFCMFSTIALAARGCSDLCDRVLIFDWDVHHGNGTQDCLYDDGKTCFVSMHRSPFYPGTGYLDERGEGAGAGLNYNIPLPGGCGDAEYLAAYFDLVRPIIKDYDPQLILVSAGYDSHKLDPLGGMAVTDRGFAQLAGLVAEDAENCSAQGRLVGFLEGGYSLGGLSTSVAATLEVWCGQRKVTVKKPLSIDPTVQRQITKVRNRFF